MKPTDSDQQNLKSASELGSLARPGPTLFGSHPTAMLRKANGNDPTHLPPNRPFPQPVASAPDFAMQFKPCLESIPVPAGTDLRADLIEAVKAAVGEESAEHSLYLHPKAPARYRHLAQTRRQYPHRRPIAREEHAADQCAER